MRKRSRTEKLQSDLPTNRNSMEDIKKYTRTELFEVILLQAKEIDRLNEKFAETNTILTQEAKEVAEASASLVKVCQAAVAAIEQSVESLRQLHLEKSLKDESVQEI
ncbi:MAG: hypothetical protein ACK5ML_07885 [Lachnospiraceae bacterium]